MASLVSQKLKPLKDTKPSFNGRTVIVTGANVGLGFECAVKFVQLGADRVVLANNQQTGNPDVYVVSVCPGVTQSEFGRDRKGLWYMRPMIMLFSLVMRTGDEGARTPAPLLKDKDLQAEVWKEIIDGLKKDVP
ncbi:hypothetical protein LTR85_010837 [Meristemomyces frigidus]|nr:hypothetical protein LTR85_010837 [Meristemomyces frigidus]